MKAKTICEVTIVGERVTPLADIDTSIDTSIVDVHFFMDRNPGGYFYVHHDHIGRLPEYTWIYDTFNVALVVKVHVPLVTCGSPEDTKTRIYRAALRGLMDTGYFETNKWGTIFFKGYDDKEGLKWLETLS